jgi:hypothetical protein
MWVTAGESMTSTRLEDLIADVLKQALARAKEHRSDVQMKLVNQLGMQCTCLQCGTRSPGQRRFSNPSLQAPRNKS